MATRERPGPHLPPSSRPQFAKDWNDEIVTAKLADFCDNPDRLMLCVPDAFKSMDVQAPSKQPKGKVRTSPPA